MWKPELLSPAGSLDKLIAAVGYGADAVYLAGQKFGLRSAAENFTRDEMTEGVRFAHERGAQVYVVLNSFPHDSDLEALPPFLQEIESIGVDAVIASDLGMISVVHAHSKLPVHLSTQASCLNIASGKMWKSLGVTRLILGREVSIAEAGRIRRETGLEVELFIHGSMCMAFSGNCTISNFTKGRDSNRGGCAQSCRFHYQLDSAAPEKNREITSQGESHATFMSSKDLNGIELIPDFFEHHIDSIKIEGRMRSPLYAGITAQAYRRALDAYQKTSYDSWKRVIQECQHDLDRIPHRDYMTASLLEPARVDSVVSTDRVGTLTSEFENLGVVRKVWHSSSSGNPEALPKSQTEDLVEVLVEVKSPFRLMANEPPVEILPFPQERNVAALPWVAKGEIRSSIGHPLERALASTLVRLQIEPSSGGMVQPGCIVRKLKESSS